MSKRVKISWIATLALVVVISGWVYFSLFGNPIQKKDAEEKVRAYLIQQKGYSPEEMIDITGNYSFTSSEAPYGVSVTFADEPNDKYHYGLFKDGHIEQYSYTSDNPIHLESSIR
ncbi:DUF3139 domain-containing protein [Paenibacillus polysaccharolyticus]|uniref:DUF3139 domain-containing protein n=1 Tax=Paenibacillus polysaccharolyticus TaxID=582692 RepID=UPI00203C0029|nr:DUF3139 domain-containing protein [Paenibacillus polysaccharolyticus]MCM3136125.1 DUF3139 domain-containing protein [Paenibacillus polysaccharolyticus]